MSSLWPAGNDSFSSPPPGTPLGTAHLQQHTDLGDSIESIQSGLPYSMGDLRPQDWGLAAWTYPPFMANLGAVFPTVGRNYISQVPTPRAFTVASLVAMQAVSGATPTAGDANQLAIYTPDGTRVWLSEDLTTDWSSGAGSAKTYSVTGVTATANSFLWVGFKSGAWTTRPTFARGGQWSSAMNLGRTAATVRAGYMGTDSSTGALPASFDPSLTVVSAPPIWFGIGA